jgi:modulator of FtsH protease HflK
MANNGRNNDPPSVRAVQAAVGWVRANAAASALVVAGVFVLACLIAAVYAVRVEESAAKQRFGRLTDDNIASGLHFRLPWGIESITKVRTGEVRRIEISGDFLKELSLLTGDENLIDTATVVQYKITRLGDYLFQIETPEELIKQSVRSALVDAVASMRVDDVLTSGKARIQNEVRRYAQEMLSHYKAGITLVAVNLQSVNPPEDAAAAFRKVNDAKADAARLISNAESEREKSLNLADGEASKTIHEAGATAEKRVLHASGAAERFNQILAQKKETPDLTKTDLYMDTVIKVLKRAKVLVLAPGRKPNIDINLMDRKQESSGKNSEPVDVPVTDKEAPAPLNADVPRPPSE